MSTHAASAPYGGDRPTIENRKVPLRRANVAYRSREYLSDKEVVALMTAAAGVGRHCARDAALILIAYRHGLRVSELVSLRWDQVDLQQGLLHDCTSRGGTMASPRSTPCAGRNCAPCADCSGLTRTPPTYS